MTIPRRFNEGGADCPPKQRLRLFLFFLLCASMKGGRTAPRNVVGGAYLYDSSFCFNEGGADCPPKRHRSCLSLSTWDASMKGGRTAPRNPEFFIQLLTDEGASMKGGRTAPRNDGDT